MMGLSGLCGRCWRTCRSRQRAAQAPGQAPAGDLELLWGVLRVLALNGGALRSSPKHARLKEADAPGMHALSAR